MNVGHTWSQIFNNKCLSTCQALLWAQGAQEGERMEKSLSSFQCREIGSKLKHWKMSLETGLSTLGSAIGPEIGQ